MREAWDPPRPLPYLCWSLAQHRVFSEMETSRSMATEKGAGSMTDMDHGNPAGRPGSPETTCVDPDTSFSDPEPASRLAEAPRKAVGSIASLSADDMIQ